MVDRLIFKSTFVSVKLFLDKQQMCSLFLVQVGT